MKYLFAGVLSTLFVTGATAAVHPGAAAALPPAHTRGEITWLTGGIGRDEARAFEHQAASYPLELVFVQKAGGHDQFLADVPLTIRDAHHHVVFDGRTDGPYFLARLPHGEYQVNAHWQDWDFSRQVRIGAKHERVVFEWKKGGRAASA